MLVRLPVHGGPQTSVAQADSPTRGSPGIRFATPGQLLSYFGGLHAGPAEREWRSLARGSRRYGGFKKFLLRGNVVDLAVGVVIGAAFGAVVQAIVKDIFNPIISKVRGVADISSVSVTVGGITFPIGDLLNAILTFILVALVVYFVVVLPVNRLMDRYKPQAPPSPTKDCPECTSKIPKAARRCPECAAQLLPPSADVADAMRQVAAPSGADIADHAAKVLADRLQGHE